MARPKIKAAKKRPYHCVDGPFEGAEIWLTTGETLVVRVAEKKGKYTNTPAPDHEFMTDKLYWVDNDA